MKLLGRRIAAVPFSQTQPAAQRIYAGSRVSTEFHRTRHAGRDGQALNNHIRRLEHELEKMRARLEEREQAIRTLSEIGKRLEQCIDEVALLGGKFNKARLTIALLTMQERHVYETVKANPQMPYKQLADLLNISKRTVHFHLSNIYRKLGTKRRNEL